MSIIIPYDLSKKYTEQNAVYPADLTGQADGDYLSRQAGEWKPRNRDNFMYDIITEGEWDLVDTEWFRQSTAIVNSATVTINPRYIDLRTGALANSTGRAGFRFYGSVAGQGISRVQWDRVIVWNFRYTDLSTYTTNGQGWVTYGTQVADAVADPTCRSIGIRQDNDDLFGIAHNGTILTSVDLNTKIGSTATRDIVIVANNGHVTWYVNNVNVGDTALGPTGLSGNFEHAMRVCVTNGADTARHRVFVASSKIYIGY